MKINHTMCISKILTNSCVIKQKIKIFIGVEKYMAFIINRNLVFIDSMQFMNYGSDSLAKNL